MGFPGTWMTESESVVYRVVPKCACSTIGQIMYYSDHGEFFDGDIHDATGGYRAFRASTLRQLDLHQVASQGYCFQIDLAWRAVQRGLTVREVPITFVERTAGASKMSRKIVAEALWRVTLWGLDDKVTRLRRRAHERRQRGHS